MKLSKELIDKVKTLKEQNNAVILAHLYQNEDIQTLADFVGDSLDLSLKAKETNANIIVFCGVRFMAETAKIISPDKKVLLVEEHAGCPMADMINAEDIKNIKKQYPDTVIVAYVNTSAEVKAYSDICCTSRNAVKIINSIPSSKSIYFIPDMNLGTYIKIISKRTNMQLWPGYCNVHTKIKVKDVLSLKEKYPYSVILAHPECKKEILDLSDHVLSTKQMLDFVASSKDLEEFIILTETGILYQLQSIYPNKIFHSIDKAVCPNMKKTKVEDLINALENLEFEINLESDIITKARNAVLKMLEIK
jgi:quinolinate synthase